MTFHLDKTQRNILAEKIMEWGNLVFAGFVIAHAFEGVPFAPLRSVVGLIIVVGAYWVALHIMKGGDE